MSMKKSQYWKSYWRVLGRLDPEARSPHDIFLDWVSEHAISKTWLDAGCGRITFPAWRKDDEERMRNSGSTMYGCDLDYSALLDRQDNSRICVASISELPYPDHSFDLVVSDMVFEHLDQPEDVVRELVRVTAPGGRILIHTVNRRHYLALVARLTPFRLHQWIVSRLENRGQEAVYPTLYYANSVSRLEELFGSNKYVLERGGEMPGIPIFVPYPVLFWIALVAGLLERQASKLPFVGSLLKSNLLVEFRRKS